jgi:hypothetical protein
VFCFLRILYMELFSYILFPPVHCWCIESYWIWNLIWYPATFTKIFTESRRFLGGDFGSFRHKIILSANRGNLTTSFPILFFPFILPFLLLYLGIPRLWLNRTGEIWQPCFIPDFGGIFSVFPHLAWCWL